MRKILMLIGLCAIVAIGPWHTTPASARVRIHVRIHARYRHHRSYRRHIVGTIWVPGYYVYDASAGQYIWINGSWEEPPYIGAVWIEPEYITGYGFVAGHWGHRGDRERFDRSIREREAFHSAPAPAPAARTFAPRTFERPAPAARTFTSRAVAPAPRAFVTAPTRNFAAPARSFAPQPRAFAPRSAPAPRAMFRPAPAPAPRAMFRPAPAPQRGPAPGGPPHGGQGGQPHGAGGPHGGGPVAHNQHGR